METRPALFRPHRNDPTAGNPWTGIYAELCLEWRRVCDLPSTAHQLIKWQHTEPALRGLEGLPNLLDDVDYGDAGRKDELLLALLRLAQSGQQMAARTVLQAMLPKLSRIARTTVGSIDRTIESRRQAGIVEFWDVLTNYPVDRRTHKVAANLALDTLHNLTQATRAGGEEVPIDPEIAAYLADVRDPLMKRDDPTADQAEAAVLGSDLDQVLAWALDVQAITGPDAALLLRVYTHGTARSGGAAAAAEEMGLTTEAVRQRCSRARRALTDAVQKYAETSMGLDLIPTDASSYSHGGGFDREWQDRRHTLRM